MKKPVLILFAIFFVSIMHAQKEKNGFSKGDKFISGSIGYSTVSNPDDSKEKDFNVSPRFGYFLNDFLAVGTKLGYSFTKMKDSEGNKMADNNSILVNAFGRYYLLPGSKFSVFGELHLGFGSTKDISGTWHNGVNVGFSPGLSYFIAEHFALEAGFGILSYNTVNAASGNGSTDSFDVGLNLEDIHLGIIFKF